MKMLSSLTSWHTMMLASAALELAISGAVLFLLVLVMREPDAVALVESKTLRRLIWVYMVCRAYVILKPDFPFPLAYYLFPFTGVVGMIILVMIVIMVSNSSEVYVLAPLKLSVWRIDIVPNQFCVLSFLHIAPECGNMRMLWPTHTMLMHTMLMGG